MRIFRAYKTELDPTCKQVKQFLQHAGAARWAWNWGLNRKIESYKATGKSLNAIDLSRELTVLKKKSVKDGGIPWMHNSASSASRYAFTNLDNAFKNFYRRCKSKAKKKGFPKFKSRKKNGIGSFTLFGIIHVHDHSIQLPRLGLIRLKEQDYLPIEGVKILSVTVSEDAGRWFMSLRVEQDIPKHESKSTHVVGIDVGIKHLVVISDGEIFDNPRALIKAQKILRTRQKAVSRKHKGSKNRRKAVAKLAKTCWHIANVRKDTIHKMTTMITKSASKIVIEDLNVAGMLKNHKLARVLSDASLSEIHRQLIYKSKWNGIELVKSNRFFPSSKRCSKCGNVKENLSLGERTYHCDKCDQIIDRDLNAAMNLKQWPQVAAATACCPGSSGQSPETSTKLPVGQEPKGKGEP